MTRSGAESLALPMKARAAVRFNAHANCDAPQRRAASLIPLPCGVPAFPRASMTLMRCIRGGVVTSVIASRASIVTFGSRAVPVAVAVHGSVGLLCLRDVAIIPVASHQPGVIRSAAAPAAIAPTADRRHEITAAPGHKAKVIGISISAPVTAAMVARQLPVIAPLHIAIGTVIPTETSIVVRVISAIGTTTMLTDLTLVRSPAFRAALTAGWPFSFVAPLVRPPLPLGSLPLVRIVDVADGVVTGARFTHETGGGDNGSSGVRDERKAAATIRTTSLGFPPSDAAATTRHADCDPPPTTFPSCNTDGGTNNIGADDSRNGISLGTSSLLRNGEIMIATQRSASTSRGRRGTSGRPQRADRIATSSLMPLHTAELHRAALHHVRRHSAGARLPSPVMLPRAAPAPLLSSSTLPQLGQRTTTGRAGRSRTARNRRPPFGVAVGAQATGGWCGAPQHAVRASRCARLGPRRAATACSAKAGCAQGARAGVADDGRGDDEEQDKAGEAVRGGAPVPTPPVPPGTAGGGSRQAHRCRRSLLGQRFGPCVVGTRRAVPPRLVAQRWVRP